MFIVIITLISVINTYIDVYEFIYKNFSKIFKSSNQQELDRVKSLISAINNKEKEYKRLVESDFKEKCFV